MVQDAGVVEVWYEIVKPDGRPFREYYEKCFEFPLTATVADFKSKVIAELKIPDPLVYRHTMYADPPLEGHELLRELIVPQEYVKIVCKETIISKIDEWFGRQSSDMRYSWINHHEQVIKRTEPYLSECILMKPPKNGQGSEIELFGNITAPKRRQLPLDYPNEPG